MVKASEIKDEETLRAWLEGRPHTDAVAIAHRAALRTFPLWAAKMKDAWARKLDMTALVVLRPVLTSGVYVGSPTPEVNKASHAAVASDAADASAADAPAAAFAAATATAAAAAAYARTAADYAAAHESAHAFFGPVLVDSSTIEHGKDCRALPLWAGAAPEDLLTEERRFLHDWSQDPETWDFWRRWWEGARDGRPLDWELQKRVALIPPEDWEKNDPAHIAKLIRGIEDEFGSESVTSTASISDTVEAEIRSSTPLSRATPVDFTFDTIARIMRMVGLEDDTAHLRDPKVVQRFLDDCEELRDTFNDFMDYARELGGSPNRAGVLRRAAEKVSAELDRTRDKTHLRARYLVKLGHELELFAKEEAARNDLGPALAGILDNGISLLRDVTRKHFGPAYTALAPLAQLTLDHVDQDSAIALLDDMLARIDALPETELVALDEDGRAVFADMVREAHEMRAALAEASSAEFREILRARMAESIGGTGVAFGRFLERSAAAAGTIDKATDVAVKQYKKVETLQDILQFIREWLSGGGGPTV